MHWISLSLLSPYFLSWWDLLNNKTAMEVFLKFLWKCWHFSENSFFFCCFIKASFWVLKECTSFICRLLPLPPPPPKKKNLFLLSLFFYLCLTSHEGQVLRTDLVSYVEEEQGYQLLKCFSVFLICFLFYFYFVFEHPRVWFLIW